MSVRIGIGLGSLPVESAQEFFRWVDRCEDSALDSLWQTDRLVSREPQLEALSTISALAARTKRIKFGMNAVVIPFRNPLLLAKQCATIDFLSNGRLLPVFGVGAESAPEWRASSSGSPAGRGTRANEALELMQRLWTEPRVSYRGAHYDYTDVSLAPQPIQQPLPCWIGGSSPAAIRRTARYGTGWLGGTQGPERVRRVIQAIRRDLEATGREIAPDHYGATLAFRLQAPGERPEPRLEGVIEARLRRASAARPGTNRSEAHARGELRQELIAIGSAQAVVERLRAYHRAGAAKYVLIPLALDLRDLMEQTERLLAEVLPEVHAWANPSLSSSAGGETPNP